MVRRGWTHVEVPSGWVQVLRGPRPPSVQGPAKGVPKSKLQQERRSSTAPTGGKGSGKGREGRRTSSPPHPRDEPDGRSRQDLSDPGFHRCPRGRRSRRSGPSSRDTDRSGHSVLRAGDKTIGGSGRENTAGSRGVAPGGVREGRGHPGSGGGPRHMWSV